MADTGETATNSCSSDTDSVGELRIAVSRQRVESESQLDCSIETVEGDDSYTEGEADDKEKVDEEDEVEETEETEDEKEEDRRSQGEAGDKEHKKEEDRTSQGEAKDEEEKKEEDGRSQGEARDKEMEKEEEEEDGRSQGEARDKEIEKEEEEEDERSQGEARDKEEDGSSQGEPEDKEEEEEEDGSSQGEPEDKEDGEISENGETSEAEESGEETDEEETGSAKDLGSMSNVHEKRYMGDGEEEPSEKVEKKLDDDEDRNNPAFIPRKGIFFEHDMRCETDEEIEAQTKDQKKPTKKLWVDEHKWDHDRYDASQQGPKSAREIINIYGYDIRQGAEADIPVRQPNLRGRRRRGGNQIRDFLPQRWKDESEAHQDREYTNENQPARGRYRNKVNDENENFEGRQLNHQKQDKEFAEINQHVDFPPLKENVQQKNMPMNNSGRKTREKIQKNITDRPETVEGNSDGRSRDSDLYRKEDSRRGYDRHDSSRESGSIVRGKNFSNRGRGRNRQYLDEYEEQDTPVRQRGRTGTSSEKNSFGNGGGRDFDNRGLRDTIDGRSFEDTRQHAVEDDRDFENRPRRLIGGTDFEYNGQYNRAVQSPERNEDDSFERRNNRYAEFHSNDRVVNKKEFGNRRFSPREERGRGGYSRGSYRSRGGRWTEVRNHSPRHQQSNYHDNYPTRTIENSNVTGSSDRQFQHIRPSKEEQREMLHSISSAMKRISVEEQNSAKQGYHGSSSRSKEEIQQSGNRRYYEQNRQENCLTERQEQMENNVKLHYNEYSAKSAVSVDSAAKANARYGKNNNEVRKTPVIIQTTDALEILPPVTTIQVYSKSTTVTATDRAAVESRPSTSSRPTQNQGWAGGEFTPAWRISSVSASKPETMNPAPAGKPKRYSTLRQKVTGTEAVAYNENVNSDFQGTEQALQSMLPQQNTALPLQHLPSSTAYYGSDPNSSYTTTSFPPAPTLPLGMHSLAYPVPGNSPHSPYPGMNNPQVAKPGTPIHGMYLPPPASMVPSHYMPMSTVMNYPSHYQMGSGHHMAAVQMASTGNAGHLRQDQEAVDLHHLVYFPPGIPLPVMHPQFVDQSGYLNDSQVDHSLAQHGYAESSEIESPSQGSHDY